MKKLIFLLTLVILGVTSAFAREPYGDYIARYIVTMENGRPTYHTIYNPIKITHQGIQVKNTNAGTKTWAAHYNGPVRLFFQSGRQVVTHNFTLTNQHVEFSISDQAIERYNGRYYYVINFDGQYQLAEAI
ncbi:MAG: hypothetical protein NC453_19905 [Muribaculum sp.]|nr:hypothetical protein [Muribaculum sp.]